MYELFEPTPEQQQTNSLENKCLASYKEENLKPAIFIDESPEFNPEEGTESISYVVFCAMEFDDDPINKEGYIRCWDLDEAYDIAEEFRKKFPSYEYVGMI